MQHHGFALTLQAVNRANSIRNQRQFRGLAFAARKTAIAGGKQAVARVEDFAQPVSTVPQIAALAVEEQDGRCIRIIAAGAAQTVRAVPSAIVSDSASTSANPIEAGSGNVPSGLYSRDCWLKTCIRGRPHTRSPRPKAVLPRCF